MPSFFELHPERVDLAVRRTAVRDALFPPGSVLADFLHGDPMGAVQAHVKRELEAAIETALRGGLCG